MKSVSGLDLPAIITVGAIGVLLTAASIVGITALYNYYSDKTQEQNWETVSQTTFQKIQVEQKTKLASYGYSDEAKTMVHIPIEDAMKKIVDEHAKK